MKATFENTVDILVKAYLNNTLSHGSCEACAVGNIIHAAGFKRYGGLEHKNMPPDSCGNWKALFVTTGGGRQLSRKKGIGNWEYDPAWVLAAEQMIAATGYTEDDLACVEYAFETASKDGDWMFNGLMAVVDVLADIHGIDLKVKEQAKLLFVK